MPVVARGKNPGHAGAGLPIEIASWFESPNSYLDDGRPRDLLASEPELVFGAAADSLVAATHG